MSAQTLPRLLDRKALADELAVGGCWLYVFDADHGVKIGITGRDPGSRLDDLRRGAGLRAQCLAAVCFGDERSARQVETTVHQLLADDRTDGEWFQCHPLGALDAVRKAMRLAPAGLMSRAEPCRETRVALILAGAWRVERSWQELRARRESRIAA